MTDALSIARDLIRCPSVTPADAGALGVLEKALNAAGFICHRVTFSEPGTADVDNLYAPLGGTIKIGRRGSQCGTLHVDGAQGHVAYPHRASNPVPDISRLIVAISDEPLDHGSAQFQASNPEFTAVDVGNTANNVIPGQARAKFNIRYNDNHTQASLRELVETRLTKACGNRIRARIVWEPSNSNVFVTKPGPFTDLAVSAIEEVTGRKPELSTSGGTSDARFISSYCPVIEFGLAGQTMHQVDERTPVSDLEKLTRIYRGVLDQYFG